MSHITSMHTKYAYLAVFHAQFTKPFGYIFQYRHPQDCVIPLSLSQDKEKQKDYRNVMSFRGRVVSTGQLYKPLHVAFQLTSSGNTEEFCRSF